MPVFTKSNIIRNFDGSIQSVPVILILTSFTPALALKVLLPCGWHVQLLPLVMYDAVFAKFEWEPINKCVFQRVCYNLDYWYYIWDTLCFSSLFALVCNSFLILAIRVCIFRFSLSGVISIVWNFKSYSCILIVYTSILSNWLICLALFWYWWVRVRWS